MILDATVDASPPGRPRHPQQPAPETTPRPVGAEGEGAGPLRRLLLTGATVIGPVTVLTALGFYFGWVSTNATFSYFAVDASVLGLTVQDVVLSSTDALFVPMGAIVVVALAAIAVHGLLIRRVDAGGRTARRVGRLALVAGAVGGVLFLIGVWAAVLPLPFPRPFLFRELSSGIGIGLLAYAAYVRRRGRTPGRATPDDPELRRLWTVGMVLVWVIIGLSLFWALSEYAKALGRGRASAIEAGLGNRPSVIVYAERDLHIGGSGVEKARLGGDEPAYRFRYTGLRFLVRSGDKYFLLPAEWSRTSGGVIVLPDVETVRVELVRGRP